MIEAASGQNVSDIGRMRSAARRAARAAGESGSERMTSKRGWRETWVRERVVARTPIMNKQNEVVGSQPSYGDQDRRWEIWSALPYKETIGLVYDGTGERIERRSFETLGAAQDWIVEIMHRTPDETRAGYTYRGVYDGNLSQQENIDLVRADARLGDAPETLSDYGGAEGIPIFCLKQPPAPGLYNDRFEPAWEEPFGTRARAKKKV